MSEVFKMNKKLEGLSLWQNEITAEVREDEREICIHFLSTVEIFSQLLKYFLLMNIINFRVLTFWARAFN